MRYDCGEKRILISVEELVTLARRASASIAVYGSEAHRGGSESCDYSIDVSHGGMDFRIFAPVPRFDGGTLSLSFPTASSPSKPSKADTAQARGEAFLLALIAAENGLLSDSDSGKFRISISYFNGTSGECCEFCEHVDKDKLSEFTERCLKRIMRHALAERERGEVRLPSMKKAAFPYGKMRQGQEEFIRAAYSTMLRGGELFGAAPTGTGKTVSTLYPAIRALGAGAVDKVFYLTPKTTISEPVRECLSHFTKQGVKVRAMILSSKERSCEGGLACRESKSACPRLDDGRLSEALFALFEEGLTTAELSDFKRIANSYTVCPYELSLCYAELCDIVVCDFNYVFDPSVYIRRFFDKGGNYGFLIDEAHNLAQRTREMYSAELSCSDILAPCRSDVLAEHSETVAAAKKLEEKFRAALFPYVSEELRENPDGTRHGAYHTRSLPAELYTLFDEAIEITEKDIRRNLSAEDEERGSRLVSLRDYSATLKKFRDAAASFDDGFELFIFCDEEQISAPDGEQKAVVNLRAKIFCIDTGAVLREKLKLGRCAIFFSGTLSPLEYFKDTLGGGRTSRVLEIASPFVSEQVSVSVFDSVSTRFNEREDTLIPLCRVIGAALAPKPGHYMIFTPSYAYCEAIYRVFRARYPKIRAILQTPNMSAAQKREFLAEFSGNENSYLAAFCVTGGIFSEGIDLPGSKLIGAVIVGISMPTPSYETEAISAYYDEKLESGRLYAYIYPGLNKVLQAAGRVIRSEDDRGIILLVDDRFADPLYKESAPDIWQGMRFFSDAKRLNAAIDEFWKS